MRRQLGLQGIGERHHEAVVRFHEQSQALAKRTLASVSHARTAGRFSLDQLETLSSQIVECAVCLEPVFRHYAANLSCKHSFCIECLQQGLNSMMAGNGEFRCCGKYIPLPLVQQFGNPKSEALLAYKSWLAEASSKNPFYCCEKACSAFIPSYLFRNGLARCMKCGMNTCTNCRGRQHEGICGYELKQFNNLAKVNNWKFCPTCRHLVERTYGCDHMTCVCGARFCYHCGKRQNECVC